MRHSPRTIQDHQHARQPVTADAAAFIEEGLSIINKESQSQSQCSSFASTWAALDAANTEDSEILMRKKEAWKNFKRSGDDLEKARPWPSLETLSKNDIRLWVKHYFESCVVARKDLTAALQRFEATNQIFAWSQARSSENIQAFLQSFGLARSNAADIFVSQSKYQSSLNDMRLLITDIVQCLPKASAIGAEVMSRVSKAVDEGEAKRADMLEIIKHLGDNKSGFDYAKKVMAFVAIMKDKHKLLEKQEKILGEWGWECTSEILDDA